MTRKEEIIQAAFNNDRGSSKENQQYFIEGAEWSDENPDEKMIVKYLYEKKGYPIDLNGNLVSYEETMESANRYINYKKEKFIEKARKWFERQYEWYGKLGRHCEMKEFEDFVKYMEGE